MLKLLKKEVLLSMHPITPVMLLLSAMVLIPNYPYSVIFFYVSLALFFTCLLGRENNDVVYSLTLPVAKSDIVKARIVFSSIVEILQLVIAIPFVIVSQNINVVGNQVSMDANIAFFAVGFILYGIFNFTFFTVYYKNVAKVGVSFLIASTIEFILIGVEIIATHAIPFVKDCLDTKDPNYLSAKIIFLIIGFLIYILLTYLAYIKSVKSFEKQDL